MENRKRRDSGTPLPAQWWLFSTSPSPAPGVGMIAGHSHAPLSPLSTVGNYFISCHICPWTPHAGDNQIIHLCTHEQFVQAQQEWVDSEYFGICISHLSLLLPLLMVESVSASLAECWLWAVDHKPGGKTSKVHNLNLIRERCCLQTILLKSHSTFMNNLSFWPLVSFPPTNTCDWSKPVRSIKLRAESWFRRRRTGSSGSNWL